MFALADINSFYASCEKVFRPDLRNEPVIVLSNNDGCVIPRSPEAKALGIRMGQPWFQVRQMRLEKKIHVFSSNYALYHSMSQRVMAVLESLSPAVEPYSIDEMFIDLRGINHCISPEFFGHQLREQVKSWTGLTMGVGIAPTKTLAKSAQWATKQWPQFSGVVALTAENRNRILKLLGLQPVGEVWGVGRRLTEKLQCWVLTQHCSWRRLTRHSYGKTSASFLSVRYANSTASPAYPWKKHHRQNSRLSVVAVLVNESQTKMPCTRLLFSMQSGPQRNYVGSVSIAGR